MTPLTELKKLAELQGKATEGPWKHGNMHFSSGEGEGYRCVGTAYAIPNPDGSGWIPESEPEAVSTAAFITASRNIDLPALVEYVESLQNAIGKLVIQRESLKEGLKSIAEMPEEENEWDAVDKYDECRVRAKKALEDIEPIVRENEVFE